MKFFRYSAEDQLKSYPVAIDPEIIIRLENCVQELNLAPINVRNLVKAENGGVEPLNLVV